LRAAIGADPTARIVLYHGALSIGRGVEQLIEAIREPGLDAVHLVLLGFGEMRDAYLAASRDDRLGGRLHVLDPVPPAELLTWVASAKLGVMPIQPTTLNHRLSTPNKLFECMAAGVPVVASDFPPVRAIVIDDPLGPYGRVCDPTDVPALASAIREMLGLPPAEMAAYRARCLAGSRARWSWEAQATDLVELHLELTDRGWPPGPRQDRSRAAGAAD
jgi:glycosyltransferase involved in cell wall biosynthesis